MKPIIIKNANRIIKWMRLVQVRILKKLRYKPDQPRILIFTDSRAYNIKKSAHGQRDPLSYYPGYLAKNFNADIYICPEQHTTVADFSRVIVKSIIDYDAIVVHMGIVDFSPRHQHVAVNEIYRKKKGWYDQIFGKNKMISHLATDFGIEYEGSPTINMFSMKMAEDNLVPYLTDIPNLIWIGCNRIVKGWRGNYWRDRPTNIHIIEDYSRLLCNKLQNCINLLDWTDDEIMQYTFDNIHLTKIGNQVLLDRLRYKIKDLGI